MTTTAVKEKPILFSAEMVRRILDGSKTMTRREIRKQPVRGCEGQHPDHCVIWNGSVGKTNERVEERWQNDELMERRTFHLPVVEWLMEMCPYEVGMQLWVRETFWLRNHGNTFRGLGIDFKAGGHETLSKKPAKCPKLCKWHSSIHMPRWASRITLELTDVRVEQLGDISEADAIAEGVDMKAELYRCPACGFIDDDIQDGDGHWEKGTSQHHDGESGWSDWTLACNKCGVINDMKLATATERFAMLWNKINGDGSWESSPWTWALSFRRLEAVK